MIIKKGIDIKNLNQKVDIGKYFFHFKSYKVGNVDLVYEALRLIENREISIFDYKLKTYKIESYEEQGLKYKIRIDISKEQKEQIQAIPWLTIALILGALGLAGLIIYGILFRIEKIIAEIPDVAIILIAGAIIFSTIKK